ncbi:MAG: alpha/beta fold hydrolase [Burkholderiales bacterium]|nr:alpha/beta fold hydrolase [Burkholderiales bacterium]
METIQIITADKTQLTAKKFTPESAVKAVVVMPAAMGVKQNFYQPFAEFLAENGIAVLSFDYRGMGESVPEQFQHSLRGFKADILDWAEQDYNAALHTAKAWQPHVPLLIVGHSLGGQLPGLVPDNHLIDGMLTVGSGSGYWKENAPQLKRFVWLMWYFLVPVYTSLWGYFPGKKMRKVGDLPKGVIYQWSRWCRSPHYFSENGGKPMQTRHYAIKTPILALSFTDDEMMSRRNIDSLHDYYSSAPVERRYIHPHEVNAKRIGHFGFFRPEFRHSLWQQALQWLTTAPSKHVI